MQRDLRELGPTSILAPPRIWENLLTQIQVKTADSSPLKRRIFEHFRAVAERRELLITDGKPVPAGLNLSYKLGEYLVYGPVRDQLGFRNARWAVTGGAPLGPDTFRFFRSFGVNLKQVYGATEGSALIAFQRDGQVDPNTVGQPVPGLEYKIDERGELLIRGPGVFVGYYKQDEATRETKSADGWLKTGDAARGRSARASGDHRPGQGCGPARRRHGVRAAVRREQAEIQPLHPRGRRLRRPAPFVCAMIAIDLATAGNWAERNGLPYTSFMDLTKKPEIAQLDHR